MTPLCQLQGTEGWGLSLAAGLGRDMKTREAYPVPPHPRPVLSHQGFPLHLSILSQHRL